MVGGKAAAPHPSPLPAALRCAGRGDRSGGANELLKSSAAVRDLPG